MTNSGPSIALIGAGGKMGCRIADNLVKTDYPLAFVEVSEPGKANLAKRGLSVTPGADAVPKADVVILGIPDNLIEKVAAQLVPMMKSGATLIALDPAAPCAKKLPRREDVAYFAVHPCHPSVFNYEQDPAVRRDFFGGGGAKQDIVCALIQGAERVYAMAEAIARHMFAPVEHAHRVTIEQMAILEPALSETMSATCIVVLKEAMDEAIRRGVPAAAARAFLLGHINIELAMVFGEISAPFSDGAKKAVERARDFVFKDDWKRVFEPENIRASIEHITAPPSAV